MITLNTNSPALAALANLSRASEAMMQTHEKSISDRRVNRGRKDPDGVSISTKLGTAISGARVRITELNNNVAQFQSMEALAERVSKGMKTLQDIQKHIDVAGIEDQAKYIEQFELKEREIIQMIESAVHTVTSLQYEIQSGQVHFTHDDMNKMFANIQRFKASVVYQLSAEMIGLSRALGHDGFRVEAQSAHATAAYVRDLVRNVGKDFLKIQHATSREMAFSLII